MDNLVDWISGKPFSKLIILTDDNTAENCLPLISQRIGLEYQHINILPGEHSKSLESATFIWNRLLEIDADRKALLINLGGGMITDLGGFCAATYKRGISFINIPTTLLGMVDAATGGKNSIDVGNYKNPVGLFTEPDAVFTFPVFLRTLPQRELFAGFAEVMKYGLICDKQLWDNLKAADPLHIVDWQTIIDTCVQIKQDIVKQDPRDKGLRKILNYGHTIGHAIESYSLENDTLPLLHGEAVAIGMVAEAWLSYKKTGLTKKELDDITSCFARIFGAYTFEKPFADDLYAYMLNDKKNEDNTVRFSLLERVGKSVYDINCSYEEIVGALDYYLSLNK